MAKKVKTKVQNAEDEEDVVAEKPPKKKKVKAAAAVEKEEVDEVEAEPAKPEKKKKKKQQQQDDEVEADTGKKRKKGSIVPTLEGENDDDDGAIRKPAKKAKKQPVAVQNDEEEEEETPVKPKAKKQKVAKQQQEEDKEAEEEEQEAEEKPSKKEKKTKSKDKSKGKSKSKGGEAGEEDEDEEEKEEDLPKTDNGVKKKDALCTVFVGGIPWSMTEEELRAEFESCGDVYDLNMIINRDNGLPKGIAFVTFDNRVALNAALLLDGKVLGNRTLKVYEVDDYRPREGDGKGQGKSKSGPAEFEVFIKNINSHTEESELREHFVGCGEIESMAFPVRALGKNKGFAWIVFKNEDGLNAALEKNGSELKGFKLVVERARQGPADSGKGKGKGKGKAKGKGKGKGELEVFVSNLAYETTQDDLKGIFDKCGRIERLHMPAKGDKPCMGFAWITFAEKRSLDTALDLHQETFGGRRIKVEKSGQHLNKPAEE